MSNCLRRTFSLSKKCLISNKGCTVLHFSAFSPGHDKLSSGSEIRNYTYIKTNNENKQNSVPNRAFSVQSVSSFYDSICSSKASKLAAGILVEIHDFTGFSWTAIIIATSAVLKLFTALPCGLYQQYLISKLELTKIELQGKIESIKEKVFKEAVRGKWTKAKMQSEFMSEVLRQRKILIVENNCHPFKSVILYLIQFPFWLILSVTIRKFAGDANKGLSDYPKAALEFQVGGPFWCQNLSLPDPTFILPTAIFLVSLTCIELSLFFKTQEKIIGSKTSFLVNKVLPNFSRLLAVVFFFVSAASPSGVSLFWASNAIIALAQNLLIMSPTVRRFFKIPKTPSDFDKPYQVAWNRFIKKFKIFFL